MKKIILRNHKNKKMNPDLVRYFKCENDDYLIYTFGEKDEKDFVKLYVVKVMEELGNPISKNLSTDWEWEKMQTIVKQMLKELKHGQVKSFVDLEADSIQEIKVMEARSFKLSEPLVEILSGDKVIQKPVEPKIENKEIPKPKEVVQSKPEQPTPVQNLNAKHEFSKIDVPVEHATIPKKPVPAVPKQEPVLKENKQENMEKELRDKITIQKLQQENELLKKQLVQYRVKYQALKDLITKDE